MAAAMEEILSEKNPQQGVSHPFYDHPKIQEMRAYGFQNEEQMKQTLLVYLDLLEAKHWWDVRIVPCAGLQQPLVCGQPGQGEPLEVVLPLRHDNELSVSDLQNVLGKVKAEHDSNGITLGLMDTESTVVYYKISDGFLPPEPPEALQEKKKERQRKMQKRRTKYMHVPQSVDNARARYMGLGPSTSTNSPSNVPDSRVSDVPKLGEDETDMFCHGETRGASKRMMDLVPSQEATDGAKLRKLDDGRSIHNPLDDSASVSSSTTSPSPSSSGHEAGLPGIPGTSFGVAPDQRPHLAHEGFLRCDKYLGSAGSSLSGAMNVCPPNGEVPMAQVPPVVKNDSDHDSGMEAGDDEEDEGFGEEL